MMSKIWCSLRGSGEGDANAVDESPAEQEPSETDVSSPTSDAEQIRRRRLERLGGQSSSNTTSPTTSPSSSRDTLHVSKAAQAVKDVASRPSADASSAAVVPVSPAQDARSPAPKSGADKESAWENAMIKKALSVTLEPEKATDGVTYLAGLGASLGENGMLSIAMLDQIFVEKLYGYETGEDDRSMDCLIGCFVTCASVSRRTNAAQRKATLQRIQDIAVRYLLLVLQGDMGSGPAEAARAFVDRLCNGMDSRSRGSPSPASSASATQLGGLISAIVEQCSDLAEIQACMEPVLKEVLERLRVHTLIDSDVEALFACLLLLTSHKPLAVIFFRLPSWLARDGANGKEVEQTSSLSHAFNFTSYPSPAVAEFYFSNPTSKTKQSIEAASNSICSALSSIRVSLHQLLTSVIKADTKEGKEAVMEWVAHVLNANVALTKMHVVGGTTCNEGYLLNLCSVLLAFCRPFLDPASDKLKLINLVYLQSGRRIDVKAETKLAASSEELEKWVDKRNLDNIARYKAMNPGIKVDDAAVARSVDTFNFVTECFFMAGRALHLGLLKAFQNYERLQNEYKRAKEEHELLKERGAPQGLLERSQTRCDQILSRQLSLQAMLRDQQLLGEGAQYFLVVASWLCSLADSACKGAPLPEPSAELATLPEYVLEDVAEFFLTAFRYSPEDFAERLDMQPLVLLCTLFIGSTKHMKNPYLRGKLSRLLFLIIRIDYRERFAYRLVQSNAVVRKDLMGALMRFYVEIEYTGGHGQFFEKFSVRYELAYIMKYLWKIPGHHEAFLKQCGDADLFMRFISSILNDAIFLLDESLEKLAKIRATESQMRDEATWAAMPEEERAQQEQEFQQNEGAVKSYMQLANAVVSLFHSITSDVPDACMRPELVERIANFLNYYLSLLAGPKCRELKVENKKKYHFEPKTLLGEIVDIYIHLNCAVFRDACANDGRSYSDSTYRTAAELIYRLGLRSEKSSAMFLEFVDGVQARSLEKKNADIAIDDAPDEFLDPIMSEIMKDPVKLPSGVIVDRAVISRHLLSDSTDPFTRAPLSAEDLVPASELKERIVAYLKSKGLE